MHQEDEQNKKDADYRAKISDIFRNSISRNLLTDTTWLTGTLDQIEIGKVGPRKAIHALHRKMTRQNIGDFWDQQTCYLENIQEMLSAEGIPPRPKQCRIGLRFANAGGIVTFHGPSGTGKTTCAVRAATYLAAKGCADSVVSVCGTMLGRMRTPELSDLIEKATAAHVVILDDIDKGSKSETRSSAILEILSNREYKLHETTFVTSNRAGSELADQIEAQTEGYGLPIVNRLRRGIVLNFEREEIDEKAAQKEILSGLVKKHSRKDEFDAEEFGRLRWRGFGMG
ncbi:MAG: AAA family ATPase [Verrucomicrobiae bacterium]